MTINRNAPAFGHKDLTVVVTALEGANARKTFTITSADNVKIDPGPKAATGKGLTVGPVYVVATAADPSAEIAFSVANESAALLKMLGHVGVRFNVDATYSRVGMTSVHYQLLNCVADGGFGIDSAADTPPKDSLKIKMTDVKIDGVSVYPPKGQ